MSTFDAAADARASSMADEGPAREGPRWDGADEPADRAEGWFVRAAGAVGDLGNPFYREERQRDVWNEASAVGFQLAIWLGLLAATAMAWLRAPLPWVMVVVGVVAVPSGVSLGYARALGVQPASRERQLGWRMVPVLLLLAALFVGLVRLGLA